MDYADFKRLLDNILEDGDDDIYTMRLMTLPVLGDPHPADPTQRLPVVRHRWVYVPRRVAPDDRLAMIALEVTSSTDWGEDLPWGLVYFIFKLTKEAAPGNAVVVLHEHKLALRLYEPQDDGQVCLRSVEPKCPTWILPAGEMNLQGVVVGHHTVPADSGWA
jgi:hypothetical protein